MAGLCDFSDCTRPRKNGKQLLCNTHYKQLDRGIALRPFTPKRSSVEVVAELALGLRTCCDCKQQLPVSEFHKADGNGRGLASNCKKCGLSRRRKNKYGISTSEWESMFDTQNRLCAICQTSDPAGGWHTDHDHVLGPVRGILCAVCNMNLGKFEKWYLPNRSAVDTYLNAKVEV